MLEQFSIGYASGVKPVIKRLQKWYRYIEKDFLTQLLISLVLKRLRFCLSSVN